MRLKLYGAALLSLGLLAGACASASMDGPGDGGAGSPAGSDQVVLRIEQVGGFVAVPYELTRLPLLSLYADGLYVTPGAQIELYPGPALPALTQQRLTPDAIQLVIQAAIDAGLGMDRSYTTMSVSDAPTTTFTLTVDGQTHTTEVYALDLELDPTPGMTKEEAQARRDLAAFQAKASDLRWLPSGSVSDEGMYEPAGLRIFSGPYRPDESLHQEPIAWPLTPGLAEFGDAADDMPGGMRCGTVAADAAASLLPLAKQANQLTPWTSEGERYALWFRPLLPDESGC